MQQLASYVGFFYLKKRWKEDVEERKWKFWGRCQVWLL